MMNEGAVGLGGKSSRLPASRARAKDTVMMHLTRLFPSRTWTFFRPVTTHILTVLYSVGPASHLTS